MSAVDRLAAATRAARRSSAVVKRYRALHARAATANRRLDRLDDAIARRAARTLGDAILKLRFYCREQGYRLPEPRRGISKARTFEERLLHSIIADLERLDRGP